MDMSKVKDGNYYVVQSFMVKDLKLKGLELACYAIIYGFSQAEGQVFNGSLQYLSDWTCASKQAVMTALKKLVDKQLLTKNDKFVNNVKFVEYSATDLTTIQENCMGDSNKIEGGIQETYIPPIQETLPNNTTDNIVNNKVNNTTLINKENSACAPNKFTNILIRNFYLEETEPFIDQFNYLFDGLVIKYGEELVNRCITYFLNCWTGYDENGKPILNKFGYFKSSIENELNKISNQNVPQGSGTWLDTKSDNELF